MELGFKDHFDKIVIRSWQAYLAAEMRLTIAQGGGGDVEDARFDALREGGAATIYLHHFADTILHEKPDCVRPESLQNLSSLKTLVAQNCTYLRQATLSRDVDLIGDIADALKHSVLTRRLADRNVHAAAAVVTIGTGFGELPWGEGKFGGVDQVVILAKSGTRALSSILQNGIDAWRRTLGFDLPEVGAP